MAKLSVINGSRDKAIQNAFDAADREVKRLGDEAYHAMIVITGETGNCVVYSSGGRNLYEKVGILYCAIDTVISTPTEKIEAEDDV